MSNDYFVIGADPAGSSGGMPTISIITRNPDGTQFGETFTIDSPRWEYALRRYLKVLRGEYPTVQSIDGTEWSMISEHRQDAFSQKGATE